MINRLHSIALSHTIREQLAEVVMHIKGFKIEQKSIGQIFTNRSNWCKGNNSKGIISKVVKRMYHFGVYLQRTLGIINIKFFRTQADLSFSNGGFLITNKPYIIYIEKTPQIFGYYANSYHTFLAKILLKNRLQDPKLKKIFFRTKTALTGFQNTYKNDDTIRKLIEKKGVYIYPPTRNPQQIDLQRFKDIPKIKFLFISSHFSLKGGDELVYAFSKLSSQYTNIQLQVITKKESIPENCLKQIEQTDSIDIIDANLSRNEIFYNYINTSHVFVYPTYTDSFSMVVNEAISGYLPIITSNFFSIPERIIEGRNGYMFDCPFKNYDNKYVITKEQIDYIGKIRTAQQQGKLQYVVNFLYNKMEYLIQNPEYIHILAKGSKDIYETVLQPNEKSIHILFNEALPISN